MTDVLIIDNDYEARERLGRLALDLDGLQVVSAGNGEEGLRQVLEEQLDLIILNLQLPGMSGFDVLRALRKQDVGTPVIVTTDRESARQAVEALRLGACDYVRKPFDSHTLEEAIQRALDLARPLKERERLTRKLLEVNERLQRQMQELNAIHAIGRLTTSLMDLDDVLKRMVEVAVYMTDADEGTLLLLDRDSDELYLRIAKNLGQNIPPDLRISLNGNVVGRAGRTARPVLRTGEEAQIIPGHTAKAHLCIPLRAPGRGAIGVLGLFSHRAEDVFSERDVFLLSTLVDYAAIAVENARLFESVSGAKSLMDSVFASIESGVLTIDLRDRIRLFNRAGRRILCAPAVAIGASLDEALPTLARKLRSLIDQVKDHEEPVGPIEMDLSHPRCGLLNLRIRLSPLEHGAEAMQGVAIVIDDLTRQRRLESRYQLFQRYLSPAVIERLPDDPYELELGGQRQEIACLFADLRGFVDFSLQRTPEALVEVLNQYLAVGADAILSEEGTLDKFMGDGIVAFFNAPLPQEDHVLRAVRAALKIREATNRLHERLDPADRLAYGIGISVGDAIVGNIGTPQRFDYTAIGPSMNVAYRLQSAAAPGKILITSAVYERAREHVITALSPVEKIQGVSEPIQIYELLGLL